MLKFIKLFFLTLVLYTLFVILFLVPQDKPSNDSQSKLEFIGTHHYKLEESSAGTGNHIKNVKNESVNETLRLLEVQNPFFMLGYYSDVINSYKETSVPLKKVTYYGLYKEDDYCPLVDMYNLQNPENMFSKKHFFTDHQPSCNYFRYIV